MSDNVESKKDSLVKSNRENSIQINNLDDLSRVSQMFLDSGFFGDIQKAAQAGVKIMAGMELDIPPMAAMREVHVFEGNTSLSGPLLAALIKRSDKYDYRIKGVNNRGAKIAFFEHGEHVGDASFTLQDAKDAGLMHKPNWKKYRKDMFVWRALSRGKRMYAPEIGYGSLYLKGEIPQDGSQKSDEWKGEAPGTGEDDYTDVDFNEVDEGKSKPESNKKDEDDLVPPEGTEVDSSGSEPDWDEEIRQIDHNLSEYEVGETLKEKIRDENQDIEAWPTEPRKKALDVLQKHWERFPDGYFSNNAGESEEDSEEESIEEEYKEVIDKIKNILSKQEGEDIIDAIDYYKPQTEDWNDEWQEKVNRVFEKHKKRYKEEKADSKKSKKKNKKNMSWNQRMEKCRNLLEDSLEKSKGGVQPLQGMINNLGSAISKANVTDEQIAEYKREVLPYRTIVCLRSTVTADGVDENVFNDALQDFVDELNRWPNGLDDKAKTAHDMVVEEANSIADNIDGFEVAIMEADEDEPTSEMQMVLPNRRLEDLLEDEKLTRQSKLIKNGYKTTRVVQDAIERGVLKDISGIGMKTAKKIEKELESLKVEVEVNTENPFE